MPEYIYHYTDIETLSLILQNRNIRFNRLDKVDDITEGDSFKEIDLQKFLYVSCWTYDQNESIPQWNMYTPEMSGVRIKFPADFFNKHEVEFKNELEFLGPKVTNSPVPLNRLATDGYFIFTDFSDWSNFAKEVTYKKKFAEFKNEFIDVNLDGGSFSLAISKLSDIASVKSPDWEFQQEYRFILLILPILPHPQMNWQGRFHSSIRYCIENGRGPEFDFFDIEINKKTLGSIEIKTGPCCTEDQKNMVRSLLKEHTNNGKVKESKWTGKIRCS